MTHFLRPAFVKVRGCILLPWRYDSKTFDQWWEELEGEPSAIEAVVNRIHLWDVFPHADDPLSDQALDEVGEFIAESWKAALANDYPYLTFNVVYSRDEEDYGPTLTFHQKH